MENDGFEYVSGTILLFLSMMIYHSVIFCIEQCFLFIYFNEEWHLLEEKAGGGRSLFLTAATLINPERRTPHNLSMVVLWHLIRNSNLTLPFYLLVSSLDHEEPFCGDTLKLLQALMSYHKYFDEFLLYWAGWHSHPLRGICP